MFETAHERRQRIIGEGELARLQLKYVAVIGVGMLGGGITSHLAMLQVPQLLIDPGTIEEANLSNQSFPASRLGDPKVEVRAAQANEQSPKAPVRYLAERIEDVGLGVLRDIALLITTVDSRVSRIRVAEISHELAVPWVDMAVDGSGQRLQGTVTFWDPRVPGAGCASCRYDASEFARIRSEGQGPGCPSWTGSNVPVTPPTLMGSSFGAVVSGWGAATAIKVLLGEATSIANTQLQILADGIGSVRRHSLTRSSTCPFPHRSLGKLLQSPSGTLQELWSKASKRFGAPPASLQFHHRHFVAELYCTTCAQVFGFGHLIEATKPSEENCHCQEGAVRFPKRLNGHLALADIERFGQLTWCEIGLPPADVVTALAGDGREAHYIVGRA